jgi:hypothetical protein
MIATIKHQDTEAANGFVICLADDKGGTIGEISVTSITFEGKPWPCMELLDNNTVRMTR